MIKNYGQKTFIVQATEDITKPQLDFHKLLLKNVYEIGPRFLDVAKSERTMRKSHFYRARHLVKISLDFFSFITVDGAK
jgi:hypothetical protein